MHRTIAAIGAGLIACVVERWIERQRIRVDCFHFADILAARAVDRRIVLIQATSAGNMSARLAKIKSKADATAWLKAGGELEVSGWKKRGRRWRVKTVPLRAEDMAPGVPEHVAKFEALRSANPGCSLPRRHRKKKSAEFKLYY